MVASPSGESPSAPSSGAESTPPSVSNVVEVDEFGVVVGVVVVDVLLLLVVVVVVVVVDDVVAAVVVVVPGAVVVVAGAAVVGGRVGAMVVGALVGAAVVGGLVDGGAVVGGSLDDVDPEEPPTVVVDSATVVDVVEEVLLVDETLVSAHSSSSSPAVVVVVVADAAERCTGSAIRAPTAIRPTTIKGVAGRPARCWRIKTTAPASSESAPTTTSVPTEPPEIGRSQGWASMAEVAVAAGGAGQPHGSGAVVPARRKCCSDVTVRSVGQSGRRRCTRRSAPASMPGSCTATWPNRSAASSETMASTSVQSVARGPSLM